MSLHLVSLGPDLVVQLQRGPLSIMAVCSAVMALVVEFAIVVSGELVATISLVTYLVCATGQRSSSARICAFRRLGGGKLLQRCFRGDSAWASLGLGRFVVSLEAVWFGGPW